MVTGPFDVLRYALYPALAIPIGGLLAALSSPGENLRSSIQHFTAGVIFAALATELLPDLMHRRMPFVTLGGFSLGVAAMLGMKSIIEILGKKGIIKPEQPTGLIAVLGIDVLLDGMLIGLGFAAGQKQGILLTFALSLEVFFLGVSSGTAIAQGKTSLKNNLLVAVFFAVFLLLGASLGAVVLATAAGTTLDAILSFGVAALLYLVIEELLVEAHEVKESPLQAAMFFVGFISLFTFEMLM